METTLNTLKNLYAQEQGYEDWEEYVIKQFSFSKFSMTATISMFEQRMDEICIRAQKAALEKAAENAVAYKLTYPNNSKAVVEKDSITNPENLIR